MKTTSSRLGRVEKPAHTNGHERNVKMLITAQERKGLL